jgi:hypothetical protein
MDMGDGNMLMPLTLFEHFIYPTAYLRAYLEELHEVKPAGGIECALFHILVLHATPSTSA